MTSNPVSFSINQFAHTDALIEAAVGKVIAPTVSLCHQCHQHVPAYTYHKDNQLWMVKQCRLHGISHHMIERDYSFMQQLNHGNRHRNDDIVLIEVSDRCNVDCPHCYHIPDNSITDRPISDIIEQVRKFYKPGMDICLTGAEASLRKDFPTLITELYKNFDGIIVSTLTNGIRFADKDFLKQCIDAGLKRIRLGLNHPSYLDNATVRNKQIKSIYNLKDLGNIMGYIGYTMASISELEDILEETTNSDWTPGMYRIRYGSDIGRYPDQERMYVSDICKIVKSWCDRKGKSFSIIDDADNNIYHVMTLIDGVPYRLIQWCDETDIDLEELRCGPWCDFVHDGVTNFLHQVIRRDVWKNKKTMLPDTPPKRYQLGYQHDNQPLDFKNLEF